MSWKSIRQEIRDRNYFVLFIAIFAFVISFHPRLIPYALGATGLSWLFTKNLLSRLKKLFPNSYFLIILVFYILHVVALLYTYNLKHGLFNLQVRLALLVIPIVVFSSTKEIIRNKALFISSFIIGVSLSAFICYALAFYNAFQNAVNNELLNFDIYKIYSDLPFLKLLLTGHSFLNYGYFSFFIHPNYFAMYITLASLLLYKKIDLQNKKGLNFLYSLLLVFLLI
ncbi:MAG: hypothetical protein JXR64_14060, partial [Spirochaetales bacterium]|nr:hypothetical protein [Spirochaetales bacterium]